MKKRSKIILAVIGLVVMTAGVFFAKDLISVQRYQAAVKSITYDNADASSIPDGTYIGECNVQYIYGKVEVSVANGIITKIELLEHRHERGAAAEGIIKEIVAEQKIDVEEISGATNSSRVIKKAVDNALSSAFMTQR